MLSYLILLDFGSFGEGRTEAPFGVSLPSSDGSLHFALLVDHENPLRLRVIKTLFVDR